MAVANSLRAMREQNKDKITKGNLFKADIDIIEEEEGFNTRDYDRPDVVAHIRKLADAYKAGEQLPPLKVQVKDGRILVREGHCRRRGAKLAISEGAPIRRLPLEEVTGDEIAQSVVIVKSDDGLKLTPVERAAVYARLQGHNLSDAEIAEKVGRTVPHVQQYLAVYSMPLKLKQMISEDKVSMTAALKLYNEKGTDAIEILEQKYEAAVARESEKLEKAAQAEQKKQAKKVEKKRQIELAPASTESEPKTGDNRPTTVVAAEETGAEKPDATQAKPEDIDPPQKSGDNVTGISRKPKVTQTDINDVLGYRAQITGKSVKKVTDVINALTDLLDEHALDGDGVQLDITGELVAMIKEAQVCVLPKGQSKKSA